jgi:hypothetical protein
MWREQPWPRHLIAGVQRPRDPFDAIDAFNPITGNGYL